MKLVEKFLSMRCAGDVLNRAGSTTTEHVSAAMQMAEFVRDFCRADERLKDASKLTVVDVGRSPLFAVLAAHSLKPKGVMYCGGGKLPDCAAETRGLVLRKAASDLATDEFGKEIIEGLLSIQGPFLLACSSECDEKETASVIATAGACPNCIGFAFPVGEPKEWGKDSLLGAMVSSGVEKRLCLALTICSMFGGTKIFASKTGSRIVFMKMKYGAVYNF